MARNELPRAECDFLAVLSGKDLKARVKALHLCGWSLGAIANAFNPPKQRSTIRSWTTLTLTPLTSPPPPSPSSSSSSSSSSIPAAEKITPGRPRPSSRSRARRTYSAAAPVVSPAEAQRIAELAPVAGMYRARANPSGKYAIANNELTSLCKDLYQRGASIKELALAAGVTYRAMARRVGVGK